MTLESLFAAVLQLSFYGTIGCGVILVCALINYARAPRWISMALSPHSAMENSLRARA